MSTGAATPEGACTVRDYAYADSIRISDLLLRCIVGVNPDERDRKQDVVINLILYTDLKQAGLSDNLEHTVNYQEIKGAVMQLVENSSFFLVERMAEAIASVCLSFSSIEAVVVRVEKPGALRFVRSVGVEIFRERPVEAMS